ncbi:MAG: tandem-95 repeat protein [Ramlibacter sp.]|jgi:hypothetical protein|nr:tandem-95 repeat protein [Ramlibacter sp.]
MTATTLAAGELAIIGYDTEDTGSPGLDSISFVLLKAIGSGTQIFFTDRAWNGTTFAAAGGGEGTYTYTSVSDLPAGSVITITQAQLTAAGMALLDTGESIYAYQGAINAPTSFLYAVDVADANTTFTGSLVNTGLSVAAGTAAAIGSDNAAFGTRGYNIQTPTLLQQIANPTDWVQNDNSPQPSAFTDGASFYTAPDKQIWVAGSGAGEALTILNLDGTVNSTNTAYRIVHAFQNDASLYHPSDITLDTVNDKFFFVDADLAGNNRIVQGSISQVLANPGAALSLTVLYSNTGSGATGSMRTLSIDSSNGIIYFDVATTFNKIVYDTAGQTPTVLASLGTNNYITQATIDYTNGEVYLGSSRVSSFFGQDFVEKNYVYKATGLTSGSSSLSFSQLAFNPDDDDATAPNDADIIPMTGEAWPAELGTIRGIDVDPTGRFLYIVTGTVILDTSSAQDGSQMTTFYGGIYKYALTGNPNGDVTTLFQQNGTIGPVGLLYYIEVDPSTGKYYVVDTTGANAAVGDGGVWVGSTSGGTPTLLGTVGNINGLGPQGLEIQDAPNIDSATALEPTITETAGNPSPAPTAVQPASTFSLSDLDSSTGSSNLAGAQVRISSNFQSGSSHQDVLTISGATSGTSNGISYSYDSTTGVMTLTGVTSFANYNTMLSLVRYHVTGDNPTNYGAAGTRTLSYSTFDGLLHSDEFNASVIVVGVNDAPVNTPGSAAAAAEDSASNALTGISVFDVDANPATQDIRVTLSVAHGTIMIRTDVVGGIEVGDITAGVNGSATITITATQNQINATLANGTGLVYTSTTNFNGVDALTIVTNDFGMNGTDAGLSGDGISEQDSDTKTINVSAVNDAPVVAGDGTEDAATINEDLPSAVGQTLSSLFGGQFTDVTDDQTAFSGSSANTLAGIAVIANGSSGATGQWQFFNGASWADIGTATAAAAQLISASAAIRFNPALNFNGTAPTLTVRLVDSSGAGFANGDDVDLTAAFGGTTRYSAGTVVLSQAVTPINDAPTSALLQGDIASYTEGSAPATLDVGSDATIADVDSSDFGGGTLTVSISSGAVTGEDQLGIDTSGTVSVAAGTISVSAVAIGTYAGGGAGAGDLVFSLNANATPAAVQALVRALTYTNSDTANPTGGSRTITLTLVDGDGIDGGLGADTLTVTSSVTVVPVNDAPSGADNSAILFEDTTYVFATADFATGFTDPESNTFAGIKVTTVPAANLMFDADGAGGAAAVQVAANDVISAADIAAGNLTYLPEANASGTPYTSFTFAVQDNGGVANGGVEFDQSASTFTLNVSPVNDAPVLDLDSGAGGTGAAAAYTEAAAPTQMAPAATVTDVDSADFSGGTLTVSFAANGAPADQLTVRNVGTGVGQIGVSGANISYAGTAIGSFSGGTNGSDLVITLNGNATAAAVQELARNISFSNNSPAPSTLARSVSFTLLDGDGNANSGSDTASATATIMVSSINDAPTGSVTISGTATQGQTLTASNTLADGDGLGAITYQWQADGVDIGGATASTLLLGQAQVGKVITVLANYTDAGGAAESVASGATAAVVNINDAPTGSVTISGTTTEGQTLTASNTLADPDGLGAITYQWQADGVDIAGETASTLLLTQAQVGKTITVVASYTDLGGAAESVPSTATAAVANLNQAPTGSVTISGTATQGQTLTASNTLADTDGLGTITYQWQADGADIVGATGTSLLLTQAQVGTVITVLANYTDDGSQEESIPSAGTTPVANVNDPHTGGAAITGTAAEDQVLSAVSTLADIDGLGTLHYQWQHDVGSGFVNVGADQATYTLGDADIGGVVRVVISYTDGQGSAEAATSAATTDITASNDAPTGSVSITGTATEDQVLTVDTSALADSDGLGTLHYQWQRDTGSGFANVGADQTTYTLGDADVGGRVRVVVSYTDGQGFSNSATSSATGAVANVNDVPTGTVTISGTLIQGRTLTAANTLADIDGLGAITYQWRGDGIDIGGATGSTYALTASEVGKSITVVAGYTDQQGTAEAVPSAATAAIAADTDAPVVVTFNPTDDNTAVPLGANISFTFNELIVAGTGNIVLQTVSGTVVETYDAATSIKLLFSGQTLTIDPSAALDPGVAYRVVFDAGSVLDLAGNAFAGAPDYNFATSSEPVTGGRGSDILIGGPGDDQLDGGKGRDTMIGAQGDDTYYVDNRRDVVIEEPNAGTDQVFASSSYMLGANVENLTLTGFRSSHAIGNELDNVLVGNDSKNKLVGALGADTLTGGLGSDRFVLLAEGDSPATAGEWDVITDFNEMERDRIDLRRVDADVLESGNQRFTWIGTASFGADATGQLRFDSATHMLYGSTDADADAEIAIELVGVTSLDVHSIMR